MVRLCNAYHHFSIKNIELKICFIALSPNSPLNIYALILIEKTYVNIGSPWLPRYQRTVASCSFGSSGLMLQDKEAFFPTKAQIC